jgi:hypothetical protein
MGGWRGCGLGGREWGQGGDGDRVGEKGMGTGWGRRRWGQGGGGDRDRVREDLEEGKGGGGGDGDRDRDGVGVEGMGKGMWWEMR